MEISISTTKSFERKHLKYGYRWEMSRSGSVNGKYLDRSNGQQVLQFINDFFKKHNLSSVNSFTRAEELLYNHVPINIKSKLEITSWMLKNWDADLYRRVY